MSDKKQKAKYSRLNNVFFVLKTARKVTFPLLVASILMVISIWLWDLLNVYFSKYLVELALGEYPRAVLTVICIGIFIAMSVMQITRKGSELYLWNKGQFSLSSYFLKILLSKAMKTDYQNLENTQTNILFQKAYNSADWIATRAISVMRGTFLSLLSIISYGIILSLLNPFMLVICITPMIIGFYMYRQKMKWIWANTENWSKEENKLAYIGRQMSDFSKAKDIRLFNIQRLLSKKYSKVFERRLEWSKRQDKHETKWEYGIMILYAMSDFAAYGYVIYLVVNGSIGAGDFILYFNSISQLQLNVFSFMENNSAYSWLSESIGYLREYLELPEKTNRASGKPVPKKDCEIVFNDVTFTYPEAENPTIENLTFTLKKNERLALVGLNGAGKTTIIKLMCGLYDPTGGEVLLNGIPVNEYNRDEYFSVFSTVFQEISILPVSIAQNISAKMYGNFDENGVKNVMEKSGIIDKINDLAQRQNTKLVKSVFHDATELSGGENQKLALAKALYKDAPVLLLDEPTSALDPIAEQKMYLQYADFSKGKSSIFISHRLASTRFCDRILLIENGKIEEEGNHTDLMQQNGKYAELFNLQASYYRKGGDSFEEEAI